MRLLDRLSLIPRNYWDFGFEALIYALAGIFHSRDASNLKSFFGHEPILTNSGRSSLYAILKALDLPVGSKIGVPLFCCPVVFNAICQAGFLPCFIDSNLSDYNISLLDLEKKRASLAAIIAIHMFGNPCEIDGVNSIAGPIPVIEDCAHSLFSIYKGKPTGLLTTVSFFTFRCGKYLSAGEGSAIVCTDPELRKKIDQIVNKFDDVSQLRLLFQAIMTYVKAVLYNRPWYGLAGYPIGMRLDKKFNLTGKDGFSPGKIAPTFLSLVEARITRYVEKVNKQRKHATILHNSIKPFHFSLPVENFGNSSNWYQFALRFETQQQRDRMADRLFEHGIDCSKYLNTIPHEAHAFYGYQYGDCPNAEDLSKTVLLVPIHYSLHEADIRRIATLINEVSPGL